MSRAAWVGLLLLGAAAGLVVFLATRGLPEALVKEVATARESLSATQAAFDAELAAIERTVAEDSTYLAGQPEVAAAREALSAGKAEAAAELQRVATCADPMLERDRHGEGDALLVCLTVAREAQQLAKTKLAGARAGVDLLVDYKKNFSKYKAQAAEAGRELAGQSDPATLYALLAAKAGDCTDAESKLTNRIDQWAQRATSIDLEIAQFRVMAEQTPVDYAAAGRTATGLQAAVASVKAERARLTTDIDTLGQTRDRVLIDMQMSGGNPQHRYRDLVDGVAQDSAWTTVSLAEYTAHADQLGMTIRAKPECVPESEALTNAAPPGYHYMGNPRYGQWANRSGSNVWEFYGKYSLLRDVWFGSNAYRPVTRVVYDDYRTSASSRRAWYGSNREYGSSGSETRRRYATSTYVARQAAAAASAAKSRTYSNSNYRSTGSSGSSGSSSGGYKTSSYRSGSSGSSSSRSGSYRSSSYRSSSRSGGGK